MEIVKRILIGLFVVVMGCWGFFGTWKAGGNIWVVAMWGSLACVGFTILFKGFKKNGKDG